MYEEYERCACARKWCWKKRKSWLLRCNRAAEGGGTVGTIGGGYKVVCSDAFQIFRWTVQCSAQANKEPTSPLNSYCSRCPWAIGTEIILMPSQLNILCCSYYKYTLANINIVLNMQHTLINDREQNTFKFCQCSVNVLLWQCRCSLKIYCEMFTLHLQHCTT